MPGILSEHTIDAIEHLRHKYGATVPDELLQCLPQGISIDIKLRGNTCYNPELNAIEFDARNFSTRAEQQLVAAHELAHAIHTQHGLLTSSHIDKDFLQFLKSLRERFRPFMKNAYDTVERQMIAGDDDPERCYRYTILSDIIGSATCGEYGSGHTHEYYNANYGAEKELFAHGVSLHYFLERLPFANRQLDRFMSELKLHCSELLKRIITAA